MTEKRKLVEVALPLEAINIACKADKDRKTGTIRNLHKWFAPMPVPALRALIFASLIDDPEDEAERERLLLLIENLVASVVDSPPEQVLTDVREEIARATGGDLPVVFDPFCGGGSTLVEAQRLGLASRGSDLNPVPVLISRVLAEFPPQVRDIKPLHPATQGVLTENPRLTGFVTDLIHYARRVYDAAAETLTARYPPAPNGDLVIAWFWARTVASPDPRFQGTHTPLVGSWWLAKKKSEFGFIRPTVDRHQRRIAFEISTEGSPPKSSKNECLFSGSRIPFKYVRDEGRNGRLGVTMLAMAAHGSHGRQHFAPDEDQVTVASLARPANPPQLPLPNEAIGFRVQGYGLKEWADLFTPRQQLALETFATLVASVEDWVLEDGGSEVYAQAISAFLGLCVGKLAQFSSTQCLWKIDSRNGSGKAESAKFGRNDVPMVMDFVETNPFGRSVGDWMQVVSTALRALEHVEPRGPKATVVLADARSPVDELSHQALVITDPPYFGTIGYANLSDYFYVWIRRAIGDTFPELFGTVATPKSDELIAEPARHSGSLADAKSYFIAGFKETFASLKEAGNPDLPMIVIYALKEQEDIEDDGRVSGGWEAMLEALLAAGFGITGTWPVHGTGSTRMRGLGANALATYVALVCRPRPDDSVTATRRDFVSALRQELGPAVRVLQQSAIAPVDLAQAVIGPGMAIFSKYRAVLDANGTPLRVRDALAIINQALAETLDGQESDMDPATRWATTWYEQHAFAEGSFGEADSLSRAKGTSVGALVEGGIALARGNRVRLLDRGELPNDWGSVADSRLTVWEVAQYLSRALESSGEREAAEFLRRVGRRGEGARELAYRLYVICERKKWAKEALTYNALVTAWPEISRLAASATPSVPAQQELL
jgi:putative DNA methylase